MHELQCGVPSKAGAEMIRCAQVLWETQSPEVRLRKATLLPAGSCHTNWLVRAWKNCLKCARFRWMQAMFFANIASCCRSPIRANTYRQLCTEIADAFGIRLVLPSCHQFCGVVQNVGMRLNFVFTRDAFDVKLTSLGALQQIVV